MARFAQREHAAETVTDEAAAVGTDCRRERKAMKMTRGIVGLRHEIVGKLRLDVWHFIAAQRPHMGEEEAVGKFGKRLTGEAKMVGGDAVVLELDFSILVINWREQQGVAHCLSPMLPGAIETVVVIVVKTANLYAELWCGIVVKAARLVGGAQMFVEHGRDEGILRQRGLNAPKHVFPTVFQEHLRMVFKEMFSIALEVPVSPLPIQLKMPTAELVAFVVEVGAVEGITATRDEGVPKTLEAVAHIDVGIVEGGVVGATADIPGFATKLGRHFQAANEGEREFLLVADAQETGFAVVERIGRIEGALWMRFALPAVVGEEAVGQMALDSQPIVGAGNRPEIGQFHSHLRHRPRIDALREATRREGRVFERLSALLGADTEAEGSQVDIEIELLHDGFAGIIGGNGGVDTVANTPKAGAVGLRAALNASTDIARIVFNGRESVAV